MSLFHFGFWDEPRWPSPRRQACMDWLSQHALLPDEAKFAAAIDPARPRALWVVDLDLTPHADWRVLAERASAVLLVGTQGLPGSWSRVVLPFEHKGLSTKWLRNMLDLGRDWTKPVCLIRCHDGLIARKVIRLAEWFRLESLNQDFEIWLEAGVRESLTAIVTDFPETEIHSVVGPWSTCLADEDPATTLCAGHVVVDALGFTHHHGVPLEHLLQKTPFSWFVWLA